MEKAMDRSLRTVCQRLLTVCAVWCIPHVAMGQSNVLPSFADPAEIVGSIGSPSDGLVSTRKQSQLTDGENQAGVTETNPNNDEAKDQQSPNSDNEKSNGGEKSNNDEDSQDGESSDMDEDYTSEEDYKAAEKDAVARKQEYGQQRTDTTRQFLRAQTPLLKPRQWQFDYGLSYSINEFDIPTLAGPGPSLTEEQFQIRSLNSILGFRYGVTDRLQWFGNTTVGWQSTEITNGFTIARDDTGGIGDIVTGLNYLCVRETECTPAIITSLDMVAPTGNPRDPRTAATSGTGSGAWSFSSDVLMVKSFDPLVAFWGFGYRTFLEDDYLGANVKLGDSIQYTFGTGFGINERVTVSGALQGNYFLDTKVNSSRVVGSAGDSISIRLAATISKCSRIVEPFVSFGLTDRAPDATVGIVWTR
jgi:hypothetical protein